MDHEENLHNDSQAPPSPPPPATPPPASPPPAPAPGTPAPPGGGNFAIGELFSEAWALFQANLGILVGGQIILGLILFGANYLTCGLAGIALQGPLFLGYCAVILLIIRRQPVEFGNLFDGFQHFLPAFLANLVITIFTVIGTFLCILPGIIVAIIYSLSYFFLYDQKIDFWPAMEASRLKVMGNFGQWLLLFLVFMGINIGGALICFVGLLVSMPMTYLMLGLAYEKTRS